MKCYYNRGLVWLAHSHVLYYYTIDHTIYVTILLHNVIRWLWCCSNGFLFFLPWPSPQVKPCFSVSLLPVLSLIHTFSASFNAYSLTFYILDTLLFINIPVKASKFNNFWFITARISIQYKGLQHVTETSSESLQKRKVGCRNETYEHCRSTK